MDKTMDSIRPSDMEATNANMSYLYARDPSILAFGQRPIPLNKLNLNSMYEDEETLNQDNTNSMTSNSGILQTVKVYLRMKPLPRKLKLTKEESEAYKITSSTTLMMKLPSLDTTCGSSKGPKNMESVCRKFTFTRTFGPETTQLNLFDEVIQQRLTEFLSGHNCTVMTYGTTNSGKSYTLQGTTTSPGIIPRALEFVFSNINPRPTPCYKPLHSSNVICLNAVERAQEIDAKNKLLTFASIDKHQYINAYKQMQKLLQEESPIRPSQACDAHYSVWVSFAEIYNENIYDLLSNDCQKRRPLLKLAADNHDRAFIKGLKTICVNSGSEAYQVLMAGQYNLKVAATALNARSSRSHCIFTIQLLKYYIENNPESVEMSIFTFCDLAGSERLKKTLNVGDRLKEAQNINTSLLVLGRCLKSIYESQSIRQRQEHIGPFRESKLTRLFQSALSGKEQIALIVNVNPIPNLYIETQNVLNFSAIAKRIVVEPKKIHRRVSNSRFSQIVARTVKSNTNWDPSDLSHIPETSRLAENESDFVHAEDYNDLLDENRCLKHEINSLKASMLDKDLQIRQELTDTYTSMMKKLETDWKNRIKDVETQNEDHFEWRVKMVENFYKEKLSELASRKRRRTNENSSDDDTRDINELELENSRLQTRIHSLKKSLKHHRDNNETLLTEKNKIAFELGLAKEELNSLKCLLSSAQDALCKDEDSLIYVEEIRQQLSNKQEHVKKLKEFLNEAKEEYIAISSHTAEMEDLLKDREESLAEATECIADLKQLLENTNACLDEKTKATEILEEKLTEQSNLMLAAEENSRKIQLELTETIVKLKKQIYTLEKSSSGESASSLIPDIDIKREISSESEGDTSIGFPKTPVSDAIIIKTDNDEILGIPATRYEDDRESEMFVQVREITFNESEHESSDEKLLIIRAKLSETENENKLLKNKLSQSLGEIQALKESVQLTKEQLDDLTKTVKEFKAADENAAEAYDDSLNKKTLEQCVSLKDSDSQTDKISRIDVDQEDKFVQTINNESDKLVEMEKLLTLEQKFSKIEDDCKEKQSVISKLKDNIDRLQKIKDSLEQQSNEDRSNIKTLNEQVKILEKDLLASIFDKSSMEKTLNETEEIKKKLEIELSECREKHESQIMSLKGDLTGAVSERSAIDKKLVETEEHREKLERQINECRRMHELDVTNLKKELVIIAARENSQLESIKEHAEKVADLEKSFVAKIKEQTEKIEELNKCVEHCEIEKKQLEERLKDISKEKEEMKKRLEQADKRDQEKDEEIKALQKSCKRNLTADIHDKKLHEEMKKNLKELLETREALARTDELYQRLKTSSKKEIESLESQISLLEKNAAMLEVFKQKAQIEKAEAEKFKTERDELKTIFAQKELELQSFTNNRDKMISQYETLVTSLRGDLDRATKEVTRYQELFNRMPTTPRGRPNKVEEEEQKNQIHVVDLSDSETKKSRRRAPLPPPPAETKRSTRKKKLYVPVDDSCVDLEFSDAVAPSPSPSTSTRSLRNRKK